jgi:glycosyltransferase involved in cell wall biosynthesis
MVGGELNIIEIEGSTEPKSINIDRATVAVSFFVPCYNEEANVLGAIGKVIEAAATEKLSYEILIFDDSSQDETVAVVTRYMAEHPEVPIRLFLNKRNRGVSRNFFEGAFHATGRYYRLVCGDNTEPLETHLEILRHIGQADIIIPYFLVVVGRNWLRKFLSSAFTVLVNLLSGNRLHYYNGCPLYRRYDVVRFHVEATGFGHQAELLTRLLQEGRSYLEIPLFAIHREASKALTFRNWVSVAHTLLKIGLRRVRTVLFK